MSRDPLSWTPPEKVKSENLSWTHARTSSISIRLDNLFNDLTIYYYNADSSNGAVTNNSLIMFGVQGFIMRYVIKNAPNEF